MRLLLVTAGSRGDVEPFIALGLEAARAGHEVRIAAPDNSGADEHGLDVVSIGADYSRLIEQQGVSIAAAIRNYRSTVKPIMRAVIVGAAKAAIDFRPDVIVYHPKILSAPVIAEALGIPHVLVATAPVVTPTRAFPAPGTITTDVGPLNRLTYLASSAASNMFAGDLDEAAEVLGVRRARRATPPAATLLPISPALLERPDDWPVDVHLTGAWLDAGPPPPLTAEVEQFVSAGPFVYAGFGSMAGGDPVARARVILQSVRGRGERLLVARGLGGIAVPDELLADDVLVVRSAPHELVLPHATAAVHHGGIGTTQAVLRAAAVPIVVPFIADQPFWGDLLHRRGLAPAPIPQRRLTAARLRKALDEAPAHREPVASAAERMARDGGTGAALAVISGLA